MVHRQKIIWVGIALIITLLGAGCMAEKNVKASDRPPLVPTTVSSPTRQLTLASYAKRPAGVPARLAQGCLYPAGWQAYTVGENETADTVAWKFNLSRDQLLQSNCLYDPALIVPGLVIYVPPTQSNMQTILPLGISYFAVEPQIAPAGSAVTLSWISQGNVRTVRLGTLFNGQYIEAANNLPANGTIELTAPADGRDIINYVVLVGDGAQEIYAQTTLQIQCVEGWFFSPTPAGCPSALLVTEFQEQQFERGTLLYIPTLGTLYVMVTGQEAVEVDDTYIPGMPDYDLSIYTPTGLQQPKGAIFNLWHNEAVRNALGFAISEAVSYQGMMQRTVSPAGEVLYVMASSGNVYRLGKGLVWGVIIPQ